MEWIKAEIEFGSPFSYRMPDTSSQFALPCLLPGPSTVKLGLAATTISYTRKMEEGERIFELVKQAEVCFLTPKRIAVFSPLIKRLKKAKEEGSRFEPTYGTRGYILYLSSLILYLGIPQASKDDLQEISNTLRHLRRLGTSDSLLSVLNMIFEAPEESPWVVKPLKSFTEITNSGLIQKVKDISPDASFEQVNIYSKAKKEVFIDRYYVVPVKTLREGGNWLLYERI